MHPSWSAGSIAFIIRGSTNTCGVMGGSTNQQSMPALTHINTPAGKGLPDHVMLYIGLYCTFYTIYTHTQYMMNLLGSRALHSRADACITFGGGLAPPIYSMGKVMECPQASALLQLIRYRTQLNTCKRRKAERHHTTNSVTCPNMALISTTVHKCSGWWLKGSHSWVQKPLYLLPYGLEDA